jgi:hypothetical protein
VTNTKRNAAKKSMGSKWQNSFIFVLL